MSYRTDKTIEQREAARRRHNTGRVVLWCVIGLLAFGAAAALFAVTLADNIQRERAEQTAEFVTKYFRKGSSICVVGSLQNRSWTAQDGSKRTVTEIQADEAMFVDSRSEMPAAEAPDYNPYDVKPENAPKFEEIDPSEDLPF